MKTQTMRTASRSAPYAKLPRSASALARILEEVREWEPWATPEATTSAELMDDFPSLSFEEAESCARGLA